MSRSLLLILSIAAVVFPMRKASCEPLAEIKGTATNDLQPDFLIELERGARGADWRIGIDLIAQTNFAGHTWLKILDPTCAKLRLSLTNGISLRPTGTNGLTSPPARIRASDILNGIYRRYRSRQWWPSGIHSAASGEQDFLSGFKLRSVFDYSFTNDVVLEISPLIYKVDTNGVTANLIEFPVTKLKLKSDGKIEEIK